MDSTGGLVWPMSRCLVVSTLTRRHHIAHITVAIAANESKHAVGFVFSGVNKALHDEYKFYWGLALLMQDNALGMFGVVAVLLGTLMLVFCWWHVQRSLRAGLMSILHKKHLWH